MPPQDGPHEVIGAKAVDPRPEAEVRRGRPLRLQPGRPLDRLRDRDPVPPEQELSRERGAIQLPQRQRPHGAKIVTGRLCRHFQLHGEPGPPDARPARRPRARVRRPARRRPRAVVVLACRCRGAGAPPRRREARCAETVEVAFVRSGWVVRVERVVPRGARPAEIALRELTQGPTKAERRAGIRTAIPDRARLRSLRSDRRDVVRELLALDARVGIRRDEAHAPLADRRHARAAR